jgi:hypothetical protein
LEDWEANMVALTTLAFYAVEPQAQRNGGAEAQRDSLALKVRVLRRMLDGAATAAGSSQTRKPSARFRAPGCP